MIDQSWKGKQSYRFKYTGGDWNKNPGNKKIYYRIIIRSSSNNSILTFEDASIN